MYDDRDKAREFRAKCRAERRRAAVEYRTNLRAAKRRARVAARQARTGRRRLTLVFGGAR